MKNLILSIIFLSSSLFSFTQGVSINSSGNTAAADAMLDISSTNSGLLIPRMTVADRNAIGVSPSQSLLIYQTDGDSGFYYYDGASWTPFMTNSTGVNGGWSVTGNAGTIAGTNFIGTTDLIDWIVKTDNKERLRVSANGNIGINTNNPFVARLQIDTGGISLRNLGYGIGFNGEFPQNGTVRSDGSRIYHDGNFFGTSSDAMVIEKTDNNQNDPDNGESGIVFTLKGQDDLRETAMVIKGDRRIGIRTNTPSEVFHIALDTDTSLDSLFAVDSVGNVGIGAVPASSKLYIRSKTSGQTLLNLRNDADGANFIVSTNGLTGAQTSIRSGAGEDLAISANDETANPHLFIEYNSGNVGIGETSPLDIFHVDGDGDIVRFSRTTSQYLTLHSGAIGSQLLSYSATNNAKALIFDATTNTSNTTPTAGTARILFRTLGSNRMEIAQNGNVSIGTTSGSAQLTTTGTVRFANFGAGTLQTDGSGNLSVSSDARLKKVKGDFDKGLEAILGLNPKNYKWNKLSGLEMKSTYSGFIAQNVKEHIPEAISEDSRGYLTLSDRPIIAALVNAIKEQQQTIDELRATNATLEKRVQKIEVYLQSEAKK